MLVHNEIGTYNNYVHTSMISLIDFNINKTYDILEIGAGNGNSSRNFVEFLNTHNIKYNYTINEYDSNYKDKLNTMKNDNIKIIIDKWENIKEQYDIIHKIGDPQFIPTMMKHDGKMLYEKAEFFIGAGGTL